VQTTNGNCGTYGECNTNFIGALENMVSATPFKYSNTRKVPVAGSACGTGGPFNVLSNPDLTCPQGGGIFGDFLRNPILGLDGQMGGGGPVRGLAFWNLDMGITKNIKITERFSGNLFFDFSNVLNHMQANEPCFAGFDPGDWGVLGCGGSVQGNQPRRFQVGLSITW